MWFKALRLYQFTHPPVWKDADFEAMLARHPFCPCGALQEYSLGWVSPTGHANLVYRQHHHWLLALQIEEKILPKAVIQEQVQQLIKQQNQGRRLQRQEKQQLVDEVTLRLLPQAFTRSRQILIWIDRQQQRLALNSTSEKDCERALNFLREGLLAEDLGSLPVIPFSASVSRGALMTDWLLNQPPAHFQLLDQCELRDPQDLHAVIRCMGQDLLNEELRQLVLHGQQVTQLRLAWQEQLRFTLNANFHFKNLRYADALLEEVAAVNPDQDPLIELDASFALMVDCLTRLIESLSHELRATLDDPTA